MCLTRTEAGLFQYLKLHPDPPPTSNIEICNSSMNEELHKGKSEKVRGTKNVSLPFLQAECH